MSKATFSLGDADDVYANPVRITIEVNQAVPDQWFKDAEDYFAAHLPPDVTWSNVQKYALTVQDLPREVEPNS